MKMRNSCFYNCVNLQCNVPAASNFYYYLSYLVLKMIQYQFMCNSIAIARVPVKCETKQKRNGTKRNRSKRNETKQIETKRNKSKRNETDRNETKQIETKRNKTKRNKSKRNETKRNK